MTWSPPDKISISPRHGRGRRIQEHWQSVRGAQTITREMERPPSLPVRRQLPGSKGKASALGRPRAAARPHRDFWGGLNLSAYNDGATASPLGRKARGLGS